MQPQIYPQQLKNWPRLDYPPCIRIRGRRFCRAQFREKKPGVKVQYREDVSRNSAHLYIYEDGRVVLDHVDKVNPDRRGPIAPLAHFLLDHPLGQALQQGLSLYFTFGHLLR